MAQRLVLRQDSLVDVDLPVTAPYLLLAVEQGVGFAEVLYAEDVLPIAAAATLQLPPAVHGPVQHGVEGHGRPVNLHLYQLSGLLKTNNNEDLGT